MLLDRYDRFRGSIHCGLCIDFSTLIMLDAYVLVQLIHSVSLAQGRSLLLEIVAVQDHHIRIQFLHALSLCVEDFLREEGKMWSLTIIGHL